MALYRIILADDHEMFRTGLRSLIEKESLLDVVGEAKDGNQLLDLLKKTRCDLVVLDLSMPNMDGIEALKRLKRRYPKVRILVLTMQKDQEHLKQAMRFGSAGYILKEEAYDQLILAVRTVLKGKQFVSQSVASTVTERFVRSLDDSDDPSLEILTKREGQVLKLIAAGLANKNIANRLNISIRTVEAHRANLTNKLGIKSTAKLVTYAINKGLV